MKNRTPPIITHIGYAIGGTAIGAAFAALIDRRDGVHFVSLATAYAALCFFCFALLIGPVRVLRGSRPLVSDRRRRHVGIWSGIFALVHVAAGLNVHLGGHIAQYFLVFDGSDRMSVRHDAFGLTNYAGLFATFGVVLLLALSNNASLRKLGSNRWKNLQRTAYPLFILVAIHAVSYQALEHRQAGLMVCMIVAASFVAAMQLYSFRVRRRLSIADRG